MAKIVVYTGSPGAGIPLAATAEALRAADSGLRTLLITLGPAAGLSALLGVTIGESARNVVQRLDAMAIDASSELAAAWDQARSSLPLPFATIAGDELPQPPSAGATFALLRVRELAPRYERVIIDAGPHDTLIQALGMPDTLRWLSSVLVGLDGPSTRSSLLPGLLLPQEFTDNLRRVLSEAEHLRAILAAPGGVSCYVLRPDATALAEARLAVPAIQLHGLAVGTLVAGPLLPLNPTDARLAPLERLQAALLDEATALWPARPLVRLEGEATTGGYAPLLAAGHAMGDPGATPATSPICNEYHSEAALVLDLPGLPHGTLHLTLSGDELIVRIGPYRRYVPVPPRLRGIKSIRATREGDLLVVRRRT